MGCKLEQKVNGNYYSIPMTYTRFFLPPERTAAKYGPLHFRRHPAPSTPEQIFRQTLSGGAISQKRGHAHKTNVYMDAMHGVHN